MDQEARLDYLIGSLEEEAGAAGSPLPLGASFAEKLARFRGLCNTRRPEPVTEQFIDIQDAFLAEWNSERTVVSPDDLTPVEPGIYLWQGDITRLATNAIVNAANSRLLGCLMANHDCIDNIIHTRAGVQLRLDCAAIINEQGRQEAAGKAKLTAAYNLPAKYVIHTVGPYIDERGVSPLKEKLLASCYRSALALAEEHAVETIAFCCISTGEFNFPNEQAAEIAIRTVKAHLASGTSRLRVIFNVFKDEDLHIYESLLNEQEQ